jgi:hypothetical protein
MTVRELIFTKLELTQVFVKKSYTEFHKNPIDGLVAETTSQPVIVTDCGLHTNVVFLLPKNT